MLSERDQRVLDEIERDLLGGMSRTARRQARLPRPALAARFPTWSLWLTVLAGDLILVAGVSGDGPWLLLPLGLAVLLLGTALLCQIQAGKPPS